MLKKPWELLRYEGDNKECKGEERYKNEEKEKILDKIQNK